MDKTPYQPSTWKGQVDQIDVTTTLLLRCNEKDDPEHGGLVTLTSGY